MIHNSRIGKTAAYSVFRSHTKQCTECVLAATPFSQRGFDADLKLISKVYKAFLKKNNLTKKSLIFSRFFLSDITNQEDILRSSEIMRLCGNASCSVIGQRPLQGGTCAFLAYHIDNMTVAQKCDPAKDIPGVSEATMIGLNYSLMFTSGLTGKGTDSGTQTREVFRSYSTLLHKRQYSLLDNCIRTWLYIRDIDSNYRGVVAARKNLFADQGLIPETRFIASTGIEGRVKKTSQLVSMDAVVISNLEPKQIVRMKAPAHLNPTYEYGVTFERGIKILFGDRSHLYISGTASIDKNGQILHPADVHGQTKRALENIRALLKPHGASLRDIVYCIAYIRNSTDIRAVRSILQRHGLHNQPLIFVEGAICRPAWLVEIECFAIIEARTSFPNFL